MIRQIMKDPIFLSRKSSNASPTDKQIACDLMDTLVAHSDGSVGMAANMIGEAKRIIAFWDEEKEKNRIMYNPEILQKFGEYEVEEGCLSLPGVRKTKRYKMITVKYQDSNFKQHEEIFSDFTAQIIQHEIDMTNGILI